MALAGGCVALARWRHWAPALSACLAAVVALDAVRNLGVAMATAGSVAAVLGTVVIGGLLSVVAWCVGAWAVAGLQDHRDPAVLAAGGVGFFVALYSVSDFAVLQRSQVPQAFSTTFARAAVTGTLGLGVGLVIAALTVARRDQAGGPGVR